MTADGAGRTHALLAAYTGLLFLLGAPSIRAVGTPSVAPTEGPEMESLLTLLDEQTNLATKSGMNADYVPGMVTVLTGEELLVRGARTVWEALSLVPGISQGIEFTGERQILARGVGHGYASGNIKFLLDDMSMNSTLLATANPVLNMPIEQVERIEVIRGPGSSVYGEFAYAGVVNVITRRGERSLHAQAGEDEQLGAGALWSWSDAQRDLSVSANLMGTRSDGLDVRVDQDALHHTGNQDLSNAPRSLQRGGPLPRPLFRSRLGGLVRFLQVAGRRLRRPLRDQSLPSAARSTRRVLAPLPHAISGAGPDLFRHPERTVPGRGDAARPGAGPTLCQPRDQGA